MQFVGSSRDIDADAVIDGITTDRLGYARHNNLIPASMSDDEAADALWEIEEVRDHWDAIDEVLAVEVSQYAFRRSNCYLITEWHILPQLRDRLVAEYQEKTGYLINTGNYGRLS